MQDSEGNLVARAGSAGQVTAGPGEQFVLHTHPVMESVDSHFLLDVRNATDTVEAVVDWGGNVTHFNKTGILTQSTVKSDQRIWICCWTSIVDDRAMIKTCCFCGLPVLGIWGQDDVLDSYHFQSTADDQRAIAEGVYGECHLRCLTASSWKEFWTARRVANLIRVREFENRYEGSDTLLLRDARTGSNVVSPTRGVLLTVSDQALREGLRVDDASLSVRQKDRTWDLPSAWSGASVEKLFGGVGWIPLMKLVDAFEVTERLFDSRRAAQGQLLATEMTPAFLGKGVFVATIVSIVSLPRELAKCLADVVSTAC